MDQDGILAKQPTQLLSHPSSICTHLLEAKKRSVSRKRKENYDDRYVLYVLAGRLQ